MDEKNRYDYVFTWKAKGRVDSNKSAWKVEVFWNDLYIRSAFNNKLLCVTIKAYKSNRRYVFTMKDEDVAQLKSCIWTVKSC